MKINLAALKYKKVYKEFGGPIDSLYFQQKIIRDGKMGYEAYSKLVQNINSQDKIKFKIYGNIDGTGSSIYKNDAAYIAISEALERLACWESIQDEKSKIRYGFNIDQSTSGMAAFPGLFSSSSREIALTEAIERWCIIEWWNDQLSSRVLLFEGFKCIEILNPWRNYHTVVLTKKTKNEMHVYGFAAGKSLKQAIHKAKVELFRNKFLLEENLPSNIDICNLNLDEKRLLHFASSIGHQQFLEKVEFSKGLPITCNLPKKIIDTEVKGYWSKYTIVWRVLYANTKYNYFDKDLMFFLF